jgi:adenylosuccinate synthase
MQVAVAYKLDGELIEGHPARVEDELERVEVVYETLEGWNTPTTGCKSYAELPEKAKAYIKFIEDFIGVPVQWVGVGPAREDTIQIF